MPLFQIHLPNTPKSKEITDLKELFNIIIVIENYRAPKRSIQCHNCQFFHHISLNCRMSPRCAKCGSDKHNTSACTSITGPVEAAKLTCCNCNGNYTLSYRGCPKFPENIKKAIEAKKALTSEIVTPNLSFAQAARNPTILCHPPADSPLTEFSELKNVMQEIAKELNIPNFAQLIQSLKNILNKIKSANTPPQEKLLVFLECLNQGTSTTP